MGLVCEIRAVLILLAGLCALAGNPACAVDAGGPAWCASYARRDVEQYQLMDGHPSCRISGVNLAWNGSYDYHYKGCLTFATSMSTLANRLRDEHLQRCGGLVAAPSATVSTAAPAPIGAAPHGAEFVPAPQISPPQPNGVQSTPGSPAKTQPKNIEGGRANMRSAAFPETVRVMADGHPDTLIICEGACSMGSRGVCEFFVKDECATGNWDQRAFDLIWDDGSRERLAVEHWNAGNVTLRRLENVTQDTDEMVDTVAADAAAYGIQTITRHRHTPQGDMTPVVDELTFQAYVPAPPRRSIRLRTLTTYAHASIIDVRGYRSEFSQPALLLRNVTSGDAGHDGALR